MVVQAVIELIKGVGCEVVAEAVETVAQADILRAMGCHTVQGFVFAGPMYEEEYRCLDRRHRPRIAGGLRVSASDRTAP